MVRVYLKRQSFLDDKNSRFCWVASGFFLDGKVGDCCVVSYNLSVCWGVISNAVAWNWDWSGCVYWRFGTYYNTIYYFLGESGDVNGFIFNGIYCRKGSEMVVLPLLIMGIISVVGGVVGLRLPETLHHRLPQTLEEGEEFGKDFKVEDCCRCIPLK